MRRHSQSIQALILFFIIFAVYVTKINHTAAIDEIMTFFKYSRSLGDIMLYDAPNNHILHSFLVWLSTSLMGISLVAIRMPAFIAGLFSLLVLYRLGTRWWNHSIGLIAMILMGITGEFASFTFDGRGYSLTILFTLLILENAPISGTYLSNRQRIYTFIWSLCIMLTIPSNAFLIAAIIAWQFFIAMYQKKPKVLINTIPYFASGVLAGLLYVVLLLPVLSSGLNQEFLVGFRNVNGFIFESVITLFENPSLDILLFGVFIWGGLITCLFHRKPRIIFFYWIFLGGILLCAVQWIVTNRLFFPRNFLYFVPLICIISAIGIYRLSMFRLNVIIPLILLVGGLWGIFAQDKSPHIRAWINAIEENALDGDIVFIGAGIYDPIYYHIRVLGETARDYFMPTDHSNRFVLIPTNMDIETLISANELEPYIDQCSTEEWNDTEVTTCPIANGPYTRDESRCFVSVYPYWRICGEADKIRASG